MLTTDVVKKTLLDAAEEIEQGLTLRCASDMIYAWSNGLAVKFRSGEDPCVVGVMHATPAAPHIHIFNGAKEKARYIRRSEAMQIALAGLRKTLADMDSLNAS